jgi:hypothetical protein
MLADIADADNMDEWDLKPQTGQYKPVVLSQLFLDPPLVWSQGVYWAIDLSHIGTPILFID